MNSIDYISTRLEALIQSGASKPEIIRAIGPECTGWPYVFGAWGEECTPANRRRRKRDDHPTIVSACQVLSGKKSGCAGCKWDLPVRMFDCRGFTHWLLNLVGINISGQGCTSQWNTKANWTEQGPISKMPKGMVCCVFTGTDKTKEHTGIYLGDGSTVECSSGVQYFGTMKSKWKYYAIPAGLYMYDGGEVPVPEPSDRKPTLRKGDAGPYVTLAQTMLIQQGYDLGSWGADGKFGAATEMAVKQFQQDWGLGMDGVIGPRTWEMLESVPAKVTYTVTIRGLSQAEARAMVDKYPNATMAEEGGER